MLLRMMELKIPVDEIVFFDTGWEYPEMYKHIKKVEKFINRDITFLKPKIAFNKTIKKRGWPDMNVRWCTGIKRDTIRKYENSKKPFISYQGIAVDEKHRMKSEKHRGKITKYPLIEWGWTNADALEYCYKNGFDWDGLYKTNSRVSCYLCPLQSLKELENLYNEHPALWKKMKRLDKMSQRRFRADYSLYQLNKKFEWKNRQIDLFRTKAV